MLEWIRENNKRIMAIVGVFLMIAFIIPTFNNDRTGQDVRAVIAHVGDDKTPLRRGDYLEALMDYNVLTKEMPLGNLIERYLFERSSIAIAEVYSSFGPMFGQFAQQQAAQMATQLSRQLDPVHYMLLLHEARQMGVRISEDNLEQITAMLKQLPGGATEERRNALVHLLMIQEAFERIADAPKNSTADLVHDVVAPQQQVALQLVDFKAADFRSDVPLPTEPQLKEFFSKYANVTPENDPHGIGYRYPNRVKIEYLVLSESDLRPTVTEEEIYKHYKDNPTLFMPVTTQPATTQSTTQATTQSATQPTTQVAAAPTTRPKEPTPEIKEQIRDILARQRIRAITRQIDNNYFKQDWPTFREAAKASGTTVPSQVPNSTLGQPFHTTAYFEEVQKRIQRMPDARGVLPRLYVHNTEFLSRNDLAALPGIGQSSVNTPQGPLGFPDYVINNAASFIPAELLSQAQEGQVLRLYQPAPTPFQNGANHYIFRITAADPSHAATDMEPLTSRVRDDWVTMQAYDMARQAAQKFHDAIKGKPDLTQATAATTRPTTRPVITTGLVSPADTLEKYPLPPPANQALIQGGFKLLADRLRTGNETPTGVIELPRAHTVVVAQLQEAKPAERDATFPQQLWQADRQQQGQRTAMLLTRWFNGGAIEERTKYTPDTAGGAPEQRRAPRRPPGGVIPGA